MTTKKNALLVLIVAVVILAVWQFTAPDANGPAVTEEKAMEVMTKDEMAMMDKEPEVDAMMKKDDVMMEKDGVMVMKDTGEAPVYSHTGVLADVTGGNDVRGINTGGNATGTASFGFDGETFMMVAGFEGLPAPQGDDFYEGWLVRRGTNFNFISTGELTLEGGKYVNEYVSGQDWSDHDFYVLTLEPNDGDPAPADHIVEGPLK